MRLSLEYSEPFRLSVFLVYKKEEWRKLEEMYKSHGLGMYTTHNLFNQNMKALVYRYPSNISTVFKDINTLVEDYELILIDDINKPFVDVHRGSIVLNYAIFRVVPECDENMCYTSFTFDINNAVPYNIMLQAVKIMLREVKKYFTESKLKWRVEIWTE